MVFFLRGGEHHNDTPSFTVKVRRALVKMSFLDLHRNGISNDTHDKYNTSNGYYYAIISIVLQLYHNYNKTIIPCLMYA